MTSCWVLVLPRRVDCSQTSHRPRSPITLHPISHTRHPTSIPLRSLNAVRRWNLDPMTPFASQLHIMNLFGGDEMPYESLHAVVSCGVKPWFDAFVGARGGGKDGDSKLGTYLSTLFGTPLMSCRNTNDEEKVCRAGTLASPTATKCRDSGNASHHSPNDSKSCRAGAHRGRAPQHVAHSTENAQRQHIPQFAPRTRKSIQAATKITRGAAPGTASQEINFWLSLERALEGIEAQLRSEEVNTVVNCLRDARRFHARVSFIADAGLKDATDLGR